VRRTRSKLGLDWGLISVWAAFASGSAVRLVALGEGPGLPLAEVVLI
jgi:hypothetical protein